MQAIVTATLTLVGGVFLLLISEFIRGYVVKPSITLREHIGTIIDRVIFFSNHLTNNSVNEEILKSMTVELRSAATQLRAKAKGIMWYGLCVKLGLVPKQADIEEAASQLIFLSNHSSVDHTRYTNADGKVVNGGIDANRNAIRKIGEALNFDFKVG